MERRVICSLLYTPGSRQRWRLCKEPYIHSQTRRGGGLNERDRKEGEGGNDEGRKRAKERQLKREGEEERLTKGRREAGEEDEEGRGRGFQLNSDFIM